MFLVEKMLDIKQKEIGKLEEYGKLRREGLAFSEEVLNQDTKAFIDFFKENRDKSSLAIKEAENMGKVKSMKGEKLKEINDEFSIVVSNINKNVERLTQ